MERTSSLSQKGIDMFKIIFPWDFEKIRDVCLNRKDKNKGTKIGKIVRYDGKIYYFSYRSPIHYFRKIRGFGISKGILKCIIEEENVIKEMLGDKHFELKIIIFYDGVNEKRYFLSDPYDWLEYGQEAEYTKDTGNTLETYGNQIFLSQKYMKILGYDKNDHEIQKLKERNALSGLL